MPDNHPHTFSIEIDRPALQRYWEREYLIWWVGFLGICGAIIGALWPLTAAEKAGLVLHPLLVGVVFGAGLCLGALAGGFLAVLPAWLFAERFARKRSENLFVDVEGSFLRVRSGTDSKSDRKLHFRAIVDYTTMETDRMREAGIQALDMCTTGGGPQANLRVLGIKDCLEIRDLLAEIDAERELA